MRRSRLFLLSTLVLSTALGMGCADEEEEFTPSDEQADWLDFWFGSDEPLGQLGDACGVGENPCDTDEGLACVKVYPVLLTRNVCEPTRAVGLGRLVASKAEEARTGQAAHCTACQLAGVELSVGRLVGAQLRDANFSDAILAGTDLRGADLRGAQLDGAVMTGWDAYQGIEVRAQLTNAQCDAATTLPQGWYCDGAGYVMSELGAP